MLTFHPDLNPMRELVLMVAWTMFYVVPIIIGVISTIRLLRKKSNGC